MKPKRGKCRQQGCPNAFAAIIGGDGWDGGKGTMLYGDCVPCLLAAQIVESGKPLEYFASNAGFHLSTESFLRHTGWEWADLEASFARKPVLL